MEKDAGRDETPKCRGLVALSYTEVTEIKMM